jgi:hypothetical protein
MTTTNRTELAGKVLITISAFLTAAYPLVGDWNDRHTFSPTWPAHAQFHGAAEIITAVMLAGLVVWLVWRRGDGDKRLCLFVAALLPVMKWLPFYFAALIPGTSPINPPHQMFATLGGTPVNQSFPFILAVAGYLLARGPVTRAVRGTLPTVS